MLSALGVAVQDKAHRVHARDRILHSFLQVAALRIGGEMPGICVLVTKQAVLAAA